jgi:hypothetical protein
MEHNVYYESPRNSRNGLNGSPNESNERNRAFVGSNKQKRRDLPGRRRGRTIWVSAKRAAELLGVEP